MMAAIISIVIVIMNRISIAFMGVGHAFWGLISLHPLE
jgi:predicted benzoate:H+ symporter BenE